MLLCQQLLGLVELYYLLSCNIILKCFWKRFALVWPWVFFNLEQLFINLWCIGDKTIRLRKFAVFAVKVALGQSWNVVVLYHYNKPCTIQPREERISRSECGAPQPRIQVTHSIQMRMQERAGIELSPQPETTPRNRLSDIRLSKRAALGLNHGKV